jgi:hypothetical protein
MKPSNKGVTVLKSAMHQAFLVLILSFCLPCVVQAQTLDQAARQVAAQNDAKVLSAHTEKRGDRQVHVVKLLTKDGVVKTVRVTVRQKKQK